MGLYKSWVVFFLVSFVILLRVVFYKPVPSQQLKNMICVHDVLKNNMGSEQSVVERQVGLKCGCGGYHELEELDSIYARMHFGCSDDLIQDFFND